MLRKFTQTFVIPGTLAANHAFQYKAGSDCTLLHASACNTSANAGTLKLGTVESGEAYLAEANFGVSSAPAEFKRANFVNGEFPRIKAGDVVQVSVTDHASHMANACVVLTFSEG